MIKVERGALYRCGLAALSGALLALSYGMHPLWWAAWLAPAPIIVAGLHAPAASRRWLALLAGAIGGISSFSYHLTVGGWLSALLILGLVAVGWAGAIGLALAFAQRGRLLLAALSVPATWAAIDTVLIHISPHGSAGSIAYSQMDELPVIQIASLGGVPAITFVVQFAGSLLGLLIARRWDLTWRRWSAIGLVALVLVGFPVIFGIMRLDGGPSAAGTQVSLVATDGIAQRPRNWDALWNAYGDEIDRVVTADSIVVLPESVARLPIDAAERAGRTLAAYAARNRATIVVGILVEQTGRLTNRALVAQPDGTYRWYLKQHLIPGIEAGITPGTRPVLFSAGESRSGVAICKDMHFPGFAREYGRRGARIMLVTAYDFDVDDWLTARMTVLRGVEAGSTIARASRNGISFVSDRKGEYLRSVEAITTSAPC